MCVVLITFVIVQDQLWVFINLLLWMMSFPQTEFVILASVARVKVGGKKCVFRECCSFAIFFAYRFLSIQEVALVLPLRRLVGVLFYLILFLFCFVFVSQFHLFLLKLGDISVDTKG